jgi:hypothetical protein
LSFAHIKLLNKAFPVDLTNHNANSARGYFIILSAYTKDRAALLLVLLSFSCVVDKIG